MNKNVIKLDFYTSNSEKYWIEAIYNNVVYAKKLKIYYLSRLYYTIFEKGNAKEKKTWDLISVI